MHSDERLKAPSWGGGDGTKPVPHRHPGEIEVCWNEYCTRLTTSEQAAAVLGGAFLGAVVGGMLSRNPNAPVAGAIVGAILGAM